MKYVGEKPEYEKQAKYLFNLAVVWILLAIICGIFAIVLVVRGSLIGAIVIYACGVYAFDGADKLHKQAHKTYWEGRDGKNQR